MRQSRFYTRHDSHWLENRGNFFLFVCGQIKVLLSLPLSLSKLIKNINYITFRNWKRGCVLLKIVVTNCIWWSLRAQETIHPLLPARFREQSWTLNWRTQLLNFSLLWKHIRFFTSDAITLNQSPAASPISCRGSSRWMIRSIRITEIRCGGYRFGFLSSGLKPISGEITRNWNRPFISDETPFEWLLGVDPEWNPEAAMSVFYLPSVYTGSWRSLFPALSDWQKLQFTLESLSVFRSKTPPRNLCPRSNTDVNLWIGSWSTGPPGYTTGNHSNKQTEKGRHETLSSCPDERQM